MSAHLPNDPRPGDKELEILVLLFDESLTVPSRTAGSIENRAGGMKAQVFVHGPLFTGDVVTNERVQHEKVFRGLVVRSGPSR